MPKRRLALIVAAVIVVLSTPIAIMWPKSSSGVTVRLVKVEREGGAAVARFEITADTSGQFGVTPVKLELKDDTGWKVCPGLITGSLGPPINGISKSDIFFMPQPEGSRLRLVLDVQRARRGLGGFWDRLRLRLSTGKKISLNPFDDTYVIFAKQISEVITEEFIQP